MLGTCDKGRGAPAQWPFGLAACWSQSPIGLVNPTIGGVLAEVHDKENLVGGATFVGDEYVADFAKARRMRSIRRKFEMSVRGKIRAGEKNGISTFRFLDRGRFAKAMISWRKGQFPVVNVLGAAPVLDVLVDILWVTFTRVRNVGGRRWPS